MGTRWNWSALLRRVAYAEAVCAFHRGEVPVGAALGVVEGGREGTNEEIRRIYIVSSHNQRETMHRVSAHAELICLESMSSLRFQASSSHPSNRSWILPHSSMLVSTLEPCPMCTFAALQSRVGSLVAGSPNFRHGACGTVIDLPDLPSLSGGTHTGVEWIEDEAYRQSCSDLLQRFFRERRKERHHRVEPESMSEKGKEDSFNKNAGCHRHPQSSWIEISESELSLHFHVEIEQPSSKKEDV